MNTNLLKLATRHHNGVRRWTVPGHGNAASLTPVRLTPSGWGAMARWPARDELGECARGVDLDRHRSLAKRMIRQLLDGIERGDTP